MAETQRLPVCYIHVDLSIATGAKTELTITFDFDKN
jgi:hypothetical protein